MFKPLWDQFSDSLGTTIFHPQFFAKKYAHEAVELAARVAKGKILDIGCGRAPYRHLFTNVIPANHFGSGYQVTHRYEKGSKQYITLDHPQVAKRYIKDFKPDILCDVSKGIPLPDRSIDTVLMLMVIEHLPNPAKVLTEVRRLLKPGGKLIVSTIQTYPLHDAPYDFFRFTPFGLHSLLKAAGFKVSKLEARGNLFTTTANNFNTGLYQLVRQLAQNILWRPLVIVLALLFLPLSWFTNLIALFLSPLDRSETYRHSLWASAGR